MKFSLSFKSQSNLEGVHPALVRVVRRALAMNIMDFTVTEGVRSLDRQQHLVQTGASQRLQSKHLIQADGYGHAVDLCPYPIDMERVRKNDVREVSRFGVLSGIMRTCAILEGVTIISGMDWDSDGETLDHNFFDAWHYELVGIPPIG